jgi:hypothetical protein
MVGFREFLRLKKIKSVLFLNMAVNNRAISTLSLWERVCIQGDDAGGRKATPINAAYAALIGVAA